MFVCFFVLENSSFSFSKNVFFFFAGRNQKLAKTHTNKGIEHIGITKYFLKQVFFVIQSWVLQKASLKSIKSGPESSSSSSSHPPTAIKSQKEERGEKDAKISDSKNSTSQAAPPLTTHHQQNPTPRNANTKQTSTENK